MLIPSENNNNNKMGFYISDGTRHSCKGEIKFSDFQRIIIRNFFKDVLPDILVYFHVTFGENKYYYEYLLLIPSCCLQIFCRDTEPD